MKHTIPLLLLLLALTTCQDKQTGEVRRLVSEWQGKEILFPREITFTRFVSDTVDFTLPESRYKVLIYVDSIGCTSCKLQLPRWKEFITIVDSMTRKEVPFLFFFQSNDKKEIRYLLKRDNFDRPVCLDLSDRLNRLNHFPKDSRFQTFLLDKDNKVVLMGNPIHNPQIKELYLNEINGKRPDVRILTTVKVEKPSITLGDIVLGESEEATFILPIRAKTPW